MDVRKFTLLKAIDKTTANPNKSYKSSLEHKIKKIASIFKDSSSPSEIKSNRKSSVSESILKFLFSPAIDQFKDYTWNTFGADLLASLTTGCFLVAGGLAYASLAGLPPMHGILCSIIPVWVYAIFGTSRQLSVGPDAFTSIITGIVIRREYELNGSDPVQTAATLALLVGVFCIILSILRAGFIDNILSGYLLTGFIAGVGCFIIAEQLPGIFGMISVKVSGNISSISKLMIFFSNFDKIHVPSMITGFASFATLYAMESVQSYYFYKGYKWCQRLPIILIYMIFALIISATFDLQSYGIKILGEFDRTIVIHTFPNIDLNLINHYALDVVLITIIGFIEMQSVTHYYSLVNGYVSSGNRELFAIGAANVVGAWFGAYTTFGRFIGNANAKTTMFGFLAGFIVIIILLILYPLFKFIPTASLSCISFKVALSLIRISDISLIFKIRAWGEVMMFIATLIICVSTAITEGIVLCILLSVIIIMRKVSTTDLSIVGEIKPRNENEEPMYMDFKDNSNIELIDGCLILNIRGPLSFYNCRSLPRVIRSLIRTDLDLEPKSKKEEIELKIFKEKSFEKKHKILKTSSLNSLKTSSLSSSMYQPLNLGASRRTSKGKLSSAKLFGQRATPSKEPMHIFFDSVIKPFESLRQATKNVKTLVQKEINGIKADVEIDLKTYVLILDFSRCTALDSAAILVITQIIRTYTEIESTEIILVGLHQVHSVKLQNAGVFELLGKQNLMNTVADAVHAVKMQRVNDVIIDEEEEEEEDNLYELNDIVMHAP